jgi:hypothetical protein
MRAERRPCEAMLVETIGPPAAQSEYWADATEGLLRQPRSPYKSETGLAAERRACRGAAEEGSQGEARGAQPLDRALNNV